MDRKLKAEIQLTEAGPWVNFVSSPAGRRRGDKRRQGYNLVEHRWAECVNCLTPEERTAALDLLKGWIDDHWN